MTEQVRRKSLTQMIPAQLHSKLNQFLVDKQNVSLNDIKSKLAEIRKELAPSINASEDKDLLKQENETVSVDGVNGPEIILGSLVEVSTNGNWPTIFDAKK